VTAVDPGLYAFSIRNGCDTLAQPAESNLLLQPVRPVRSPQLAYQGAIDGSPLDNLRASF
jgi:hypothetical protein